MKSKEVVVVKINQDNMEVVQQDFAINGMVVNFQIKLCGDFIFIEQSVLGDVLEASEILQGEKVFKNNGNYLIDIKQLKRFIEIGFEEFKIILENLLKQMGHNIEIN